MNVANMLLFIVVGLDINKRQKFLCDEIATFE